MSYCPAIPPLFRGEASDACVAHNTAPDSDRPSREPSAGGYVYLTSSSAMPGFVQIATSADDPSGLRWTLRTPTGRTRFRTVYSCRTSNCDALLERFHEALRSEEIPHHPELFKVPLRFARQILEAEAKTLAPLPEAAPTRRRTSARTMAVATAALLALSLAYFQSRHQPAARPLPVHRAPALQMRAE